MKKLLPLLLLGALSLPALAQSALPKILPAPPAASQPAPPQSMPTAPPMLVMPLALAMNNLSATLQIPRTVSTEFSLNLVLQNSQTAPLTFSVGRDSDQNCAAAPSVRVLEVGTRKVVYPTGDKRICTQEMVERTAPAGGTAIFERTLKLPVGEYMVEGWFQGFISGQLIKSGAQPVRISVK